jgi:hypothetical protein
MHLFTYRYDRKWPSTAPLGIVTYAFAAAATIATLAFALRRRAIVALGAVAIAFAAFLLDVYLVRAAPDGGQREVFVAFYRARETHATSSPLVAYQLNWKGENFYSGNDVAIFVSSGAPMKTWIDSRKRAGERTLYFVTEQGRVAGLKNELGAVASFEKLTDEHTSAEFALVRVDLPQ